MMRSPPISGLPALPVLALALLTAGCSLRADVDGQRPGRDLLAAELSDPEPTSLAVHPLVLRLTAARDTSTGDARSALAAANLARLEGMALPEGRHLLIDVAGQRLYMLDGAEIAGSMAIVVGEPGHPTPLIETVVTRLIARPYWHVPVDLAQQRVAPAVVRHGPGWLRARGMETLDPAIAEPVPVPASAIDWKAVAVGRAEARVRQKPGPGNMMGRMKFEMPNDHGIYLHDTPDRHLFAATNRARSAGCIRVADWERLATWLLEGPLPATGMVPEQVIDLPRPVPIRIVYLTLSPIGPAGWLPAGEVVPQADPYGLDRLQQPTPAARSGGRPA